MNRNAWSPEEKAEWEAVLEQADAEAKSSGEARRILARLVADAVQAQRPWASDVQSTALLDGLAKQLKSWKNRQRIAISYDGRMLNRPRAVGITKVDEGGCVWVQQKLLHLVDFDDLRAKRAEYMKQISAYRDNAAVIDKLLELEKRCPAASTPQEACDLLGIDLDDYLVSEEEAA